MVRSTVTPAPRFDPELEESTAASYDPVVRLRTLSWGAIVAGALAALSLMAIFAVLGTAIGLSVISATSNTPEEGLSMGAAIYWLVTGLIALFVGGWIASRLRRANTAGAGAMHGFLAWCTVTVISTILLTMAGGAAIGGSLAGVGNSLQAGSQSSGHSGNASGAGNSINTERAAENAARASWWMLAGLVLGASVASLAGSAGARKYDADLSHGHSRRTGSVH